MRGNSKSKVWKGIMCFKLHSNGSAARIICIALVGITTALFSSKAVAQGNLIVNGGFESGISGWSGTYGIYERSPNTVDGTIVGVVIDVRSSSTSQCIYQTFPTTPGTTYTVAFSTRLADLGGNGVPVAGDSSGSSTTIQLQWDGKNVLGIPVFNRDTWEARSIKVVAQSTFSTITFFNAAGSRAWPFIDHVSVTAVPEPSTTLLLVSALGLVFMRVSRSRNPLPRKDLDEAVFLNNR